ncbi:CARDB domain-containing protein [Haloterrigena salinisoli]|uniref:CARDB domain-containing protein n=1 Tax=Haloterrigena salinisoli TaxID=3132747 RepID=UPI0030CD2FF1
MEFRGDERAVTVQIGAVLLLAIVFAALALYQLNAVPAENERVEFAHNQAVHDELQELRNAIRNVGTDGGTESTAVTLGTQYPSRAVAANPPAPPGRLETTGTATISIDARFSGDASEYDGDPANLTGDHETTTLAYTPDYGEYGSAPTTRIEHGFAFNDFGDAQVSLTAQPLLSDGTIRLVALEGELSRSGSGAVTIDPTALSGPSDAVPIEPENGSDSVTVTIPTAAPTAWNDTIGATFDDGESGARVTGYNATDAARGSLTIELAEAEYDLQVARVGIGDGGARTAAYDVEKTRTESETTGGGSGAYDVEWDLNRIDAENDRVSCTADRCTFDAAGAGDTATMVVETDPSIDDATVEYAVSDRDTGRVDPGSGSTRDGVHRTNLEARSEGEVTAFASSGGNGDRVPIDITFAGASGPFFAVATEWTNSPVSEGETLSVTATVENTGSDAGTRDIALDIGGQRRDATAVSLGAGESTRVTLEWATTDGDAGEYAAVVASADSDATVGVTVESVAGPTVDSFTSEQRPGNNVGIRYGWSVSSGAAELDAVTVALSRDGTTVDERTTAVGGGTASAKNEEFSDLGNGREYTLELTVSDVEGNSQIATRRQVAG